MSNIVRDSEVVELSGPPYFSFGEKVSLQVMADAFNLINKNNTLDVNLLYTAAGQETAASDPRQFQFGARLSF